MKMVLFFLLFSARVWASESLLSCAPVGGELNNDSTYTTYSLDKNGSDQNLTTAFRKTIVGPGDESTLEKTMYTIGFIYRESQNGFELGYMAGEDLFLVSADFISPIRGGQALAQAIILLEFNNTPQIFRGLMEPPPSLEAWQCLVNVEELRKFQVNEESKMVAFAGIRKTLIERKIARALKGPRKPVAAEQAP